MSKPADDVSLKNLIAMRRLFSSCVWGPSLGLPLLQHNQRHMTVQASVASYTHGTVITTRKATSISMLGAAVAGALTTKGSVAAPPSSSSGSSLVCGTVCPAPSLLRKQHHNTTPREAQSTTTAPTTPPTTGHGNIMGCGPAGASAGVTPEAQNLTPCLDWTHCSPAPHGCCAHGLEARLMSQVDDWFANVS